jgi:hypothetical protein
MRYLKIFARLRAKQALKVGNMGGSLSKNMKTPLPMTEA